MTRFTDRGYRAEASSAARQTGSKWTFEHHYQALLDVFGEDAAAMDDYLRLMCNEEQRLLLHLDGRDLQRLREVAHYLCGMGSFFGAQRLSVLAGAVEPGRDAEEVLGHAKALHDYLAGFIDALRASSEEASAAANNTNAISDTSHGNASGAALEH